MRLRRDLQFALACSVVMLVAWLVFRPDLAKSSACWPSKTAVVP